MVGIIHELLFGFVEKNFGTEAVKNVKDPAGVGRDRKFRLDTICPDDEWSRIINSVIKVSGLEPEQAETAFARHCGEELLSRFAGFFNGVTSARDMIKRQPAIHNSIAASVQDPQARKFIMDKFRLEEKDGETIMHYVSPNRLCVFYKGLAQWLADHFNETVEIHEPRCVKKGDSECEVHVKYKGKKQQAYNCAMSGLKNDAAKITGPLRDLDAAADQLAEAVTGNFDFTVQVASTERTVQKLVVMINFLLDAIRRFISTLEAQNKQLVEANSELEAFSYSVSHDLRAPLRAIDGFSALLEQEFSGVLDKTGQDYLRRIRYDCVRMSESIDTLQKLSTITRQEMEWKKVDLAAIAGAVISRLRENEPGRAVEFDAPDKLEVNGDPGLLVEVVENLINNAWKFTGKAARARIELGFTPGEEETIYFVKDNGTGFDMAYADKLFQPFQRLHTQDEFPGSGIGLSIVQRVIERHGGRVWAEAAENTGAAFYFTLGGRDIQKEPCTF